MTVLEYFEHFVNGAGLRTLGALFGFAPQGVPEHAAAPAPQGKTATVELSKERGPLALPRLRAPSLAAVPHVLLHGSQATNDACDFSDVDIVAIVEDRRSFSAAEYAAAATELRGLLRAVYRYDALMHHGLMFFPASGLDAYDQTFLPVETLRKAYPLHGPPQLTLRLRNADVTALRTRARTAVSVLRRHLDDRSYEADDFAFKRMISNVLLLPSLLAATRGQCVYKRDSFELVRPWFAQNAWSGIARAESYREQWQRPDQPALQQFLGEHAHPCLRVRWSVRRPPRANAARVAASEADRWAGELRETLDNAWEIAA